MEDLLRKAYLGTNDKGHKFIYEWIVSFNERVIGVDTSMQDNGGFYYVLTLAAGHIHIYSLPYKERGGSPSFFGGDIYYFAKLKAYYLSGLKIRWKSCDGIYDPFWFEDNNNPKLKVWQEVYKSTLDHYGKLQKQYA